MTAYPHSLTGGRALAGFESLPPSEKSPASPGRKGSGNPSQWGDFDLLIATSMFLLRDHGLLLQAFSERSAWEDRDIFVIVEDVN
jgi:hypothetical protein